MALQIYMDRNLKEINEFEFESLVLNNGGLTLVEFGAPWCPPYKALVPTLKKLAEEYETRVNVYTVNTDNSPELAIRYEIRGLPTVILFNGQKIISRLNGKQPLAAYQTAIESGFTNV